MHLAESLSGGRGNRGSGLRGYSGVGGVHKAGAPHPDASPNIEVLFSRPDAPMNCLLSVKKENCSTGS